MARPNSNGSEPPAGTGRRRAAEIRGVDERGAGWIDLRYEHVNDTAVEGSIEGARAGWKVGGLRGADDVGVAGAIDGDAVAEVVTGSAEERRVFEAGIDDELTIDQVDVTDRECITMAGATQHVAAVHRHAHLAVTLPRNRRRVAEHAHRRLDFQRALVVDRQAFCTRVVDADVGDAATRTDPELVFQCARLAAHHQVDARPEIAIDHLGVTRQSGAPPRGIVAAQVVHFAGHRRLRLDHDPGIRAGESHGEHHATVGAVRRILQEGQECGIAGQLKAVPRARGVIANVRIGLAAVLDEGRREAAERGPRTLVRAAVARRGGVVARLINNHRSRGGEAGGEPHEALLIEHLIFPASP